MMDAYKIQEKSKEVLNSLKNKVIDVVDIKTPFSIDSAIDLSKVISKLSPLVGNMLEFSIVDILNGIEWNCEGKWIRQDPDFPDALFKTQIVEQNVGLEVKAWFPFSTEITGRFKTSTDILDKNLYDVALIAWIPEFVFWGKPLILDIGIFDGCEIAKARNQHYHKPPQYLIREPQDTSDRTDNLKQRNTSGFRFQTSKTNNIADAENYMATIQMYSEYDTKSETQTKIRQLLSEFEYREDTNYAKIDRIEHKGIENFKEKILKMNYKEKTINDWKRLLNNINENEFREELKKLLK